MWTTANSGPRLRKLGFFTALVAGLALASTSPTRAEEARSNGDAESRNDGGSQPVLFHWISLPQLRFRVKPTKQLRTSLDRGFSIAGFCFGSAAGDGP